MYSFKNFYKLPLDDQLYPISCILKQVVGIIMSQVTAVVVLDFCDDIASIQLTLGRTSDLHLFQEHPRVVPINQITFNSISAFMFLGRIFCWDVPLSRTTRHWDYTRATPRYNRIMMKMIEWPNYSFGILPARNCVARSEQTPTTKEVHLVSGLHIMQLNF